MNHIEFLKKHRVETEAIKLTMANYSYSRKKAIDLINRTTARSWFVFTKSVKGARFWYILADKLKVHDIEVTDAEQIKP